MVLEWQFRRAGGEGNVEGARFEMAHVSIR